MGVRETKLLKSEGGFERTKEHGLTVVGKARIVVEQNVERVNGILKTLDGVVKARSPKYNQIFVGRDSWKSNA